MPRYHRVAHSSIVLICFVLIYQTQADIDCINCLCNHNVDPYELQCPNDKTGTNYNMDANYTNDPNIIINAKRNESVKILCATVLPWNEQYIPILPIGNVETFIISSCHWPDKLRDVMQKFGTNSTRALKIERTVDKEVSLTKNNLQGLEKLERLNVINCNLRNVEKDALSNLINLIEIDFRKNKLHLTDEMFRNNVKLEKLEFGQNDLLEIPRNVFSNLTNLKMLNLWSNNLNYIHPDTFMSLKQLISLDLNRNKFVTIPADTFKHLEGLKELSVFSNAKLENLPQGLFKFNNLLRNIRLNNNPLLTTLPPALLANLTNLSSVALSHCNLMSLPEDLLWGSDKLVTLQLNINNLTNLPDNVFKDLANLQTLNLSENKFNKLPEKIFSSLRRLKKLFLERNNLTDLPDRLFYNLQELEELNLSFNQLSNISRYLFNDITNLKVLRLSNNFLTLVENPFLSLPILPFNGLLKLEKLYLNNNLLTEVSQDWTYKAHLKYLDLKYNKIKYLDCSALQTYSNYYVEIDLSYNEISKVDLRDAEIIAKAENPPQDVRSGTSLGLQVYLEGNKINCDCSSYDLVRYFEGNIYPGLKSKLNIVPGNLTCASSQNFGKKVDNLNSKLLTCDMKQFDSLPLENCPEECDCYYRPWDKSFILNCSGKFLGEYPYFVAPINISYNHTEVHLDGNFLKMSPPQNTSYDNVTKLYLSNNNITNLAWLPPKLEILELHNNKMSRLSKTEINLISTITSLKNITLHNNPWICDCEATDFKNFVQEHIQQIAVPHNITCWNNEKAILRIQTEDVCPTYTNLIISACVITAVLAVSLCTVVAIYYRHQHDIKVWLYIHKLTRWLVTEEEIDRDKVFDAFVSYSHKDEEFVAKELASVLEQGAQPYKLCMHGRDWIPGEMIPNNIVRSVQESRRTIIVLSSHFLESMWGILEFRTAHTQAVTEGRARVIVILYGDLNLDDLDEELSNYLKMNTYVKWGDPWFWNKLKYALPHSKVLSRRSQLKQNIMMSLDDKIDLMCTGTSIPNSASTPPAVSLDPLVLKTNPLDFVNIKKVTV